MTAANEVKLAGVDLNLLVVLEALLEERNVTRAARTVERELVSNWRFRGRQAPHHNPRQQW